jgi:hypothetical protein
MKASSPRYPTYVIYEGYDIQLALESVGEGWAPLIREVFEYIEKNRVYSKIVQVKEKWGGLRIYTDVVHDGLDAKIRDVEKRSFTMCEVCGKPGFLRKGGWYRTLCDEHAEGREAVEPF